MFSTTKPAEGLGRVSIPFALTLLCTTALCPLASAQEIEDDTTEMVRTSTIADGAAGDITITDDGSITVEETDGFIAVTLDSDNSVTNDGTISITDSDQVIGILIEPGYTGSVTNSGAITLLETYERPDDDDDDDDDGPFAIGTDRVGILLDEGGVFTGDIDLQAGSSIYVEGNQSSALRLSSTLDGNLIQDGTLYVIGDDAVTLDIEADITGDVLLSSTIQAYGENALGVDITGDIGGNLTLESSVTSSGFESLSNTNYVAPAYVDEDTLPLDERLDADALLDNTGAVVIGGSISEGFLINGIIDSYINEEEAEDEDKDTIEDFDENRSTGSIYSYGSGTALLISADADGEADGDLTLGAVVETVRDTLDDDDDDDYTETLATFDYDYGFINRGTISATGLNVGFDATAVRIEGEQSGTGQTIIEGGVYSSGTIQAYGYEADATALSIGSNTVIPELINAGTILARTSTTDGNDALAVVIDEGADLTSIKNTGSIIARTIGESGTAIAIQDSAATVESLINRGTITAYASDDGEDVTDYGEVVAIDFRSHDAASGVTILQEYETPTEDVNEDGGIGLLDVTTPSITGDILLGAGNDRFDLLAGSVTGDIDFGVGDSVLNVDNATITGDLYFDTGEQELALSESEFEGDIWYTDSTGSMSFTNDSLWSGLLVTDNSTPSLVVTDSSLQFSNGTNATLSSLDVSGASSLIFVIDPDDTVDSVLTVSGSASVGEDVTIAPILTALPTSLTSQTLITADTLDFQGGFDNLLLTNVPWLYNTSLTLTDADTDTLALTFTIKGTYELGLDTNQGLAFDSLLGIFASDDELGAAITSLTNEHDFLEIYNLLLPQRTDASTRYLAAQSGAAFGALDDALELSSISLGKGRKVWVQEYLVGMGFDGTSDSPGYDGGGFGLAMGTDREWGPLDAVGLMVNMTTGDFEETTGGYNPVISTSLGLGAYAVDTVGPVNLRASGLISRVSFDSHRDIYFGEDLEYTMEGSWAGLSTAASLSASTHGELGMFYAEPKVSLDWFRLDQDGYTETGGNELLRARVGDVTTDRLSASALLALGAEISSTGGVLRIQADGGYRSLLSSTPYSTSVQFLGSEDSFTLTATDPAPDAALFGLSAIAAGERASINLGYSGEYSDEGLTHYGGVTVRVKF